jgi:DNA mismatch repair protein MutS2
VKSADYEALELDKVLARLARHTAFSASRELALELEPAADFAAARRRQAATTEARQLRALRPNVTVGGAHDVRPLLRRAGVGAVLQPTDLLEIGSTARAAAVLRSTVLKYEDELPTLAFVAQGLGEHRTVLDAIDRAIGDNGEVLDSASPELRQVRLQVRGSYDRLMAKLQELVASPAYRTALQDPIVTMREGRYVLPVKVEYRQQVRGIVHDQSASGATLFVEPLAVLDLTNRWRQLQIEEQQEVDRVLAELSSLVGADSQALEWSVEALADLDLHLAMASLADDQRANPPELRELPSHTALASERPGGQRRAVLRLLEARHPLLEGDVVPISVELGTDFDVLLITGPNTGGKTVALKTIGLLALMAQCGMHLPTAEGSLTSVFGGIYADIGDEQSIEQSLSTFSSHVTRIVGVLRETDARSLVLLDELGAGTDPQEGSALARAILSYLRERGSYVVATTHYPELKAYAHLTPRVENASVEFDVESLSPTYRLRVGLPGRSNALAIATRLGMPAEVVDSARTLVDPADVEVEHLLAGIQHDRAAAAADRAEAGRAAEDARKLLERRERQVAAVEQEREAIWRRARQESEAMLAELRREIQRELAAARAAGSDRAAVQEVAARAAELVPLAAPESRQWSRVRTAPAAAPAAPALRVGARVGVPALNTRGTVRGLSVDGRKAEVDVGGLRVRVKAGELVAPDAVDDEGGGGRGVAADVASISYVPAPALPSATKAVPLQLDLRGQRAADAVEEVERYLDDAYLAGLPAVRIVHGHGTGAVRKAVRDRLSHHSLVRSWAPAERNQGGDGATDVQLTS